MLTYNSEISDKQLILYGMLNTRSIRFNNDAIRPIDEVQINEWELAYKMLYTQKQQ